MRRRQLLAAAALAALSLSAGCVGGGAGGLFGDGTITADQLDEPSACGEYRWSAEVDAHLTLTEGSTLCGVYELESDSLTLHTRDGFGSQVPLSISAVKYRYPNGTVITGTELVQRGGTVRQTDTTTEVTLPEGVSSGKFAFNAPSSPKRFSLPTFVDGSYELVLPPQRRVDFFLFGNVNPQPAEPPTVDDQGRTHIHWEEVSDGRLTVQFYHQRDLTIFAAIVGALTVVAVGGVLYYQRQIRKLRRRREREDDEFGGSGGGGGGPPGME